VVAAPDGIAAARAVADAAPRGLTVIPGQEVATTDGILVGLFLTRDVPPGLSPEAAATAIREQGGLVMLPHPGGAPVPGPETLRRLAGDIDLHEVLTATAGDGATDPDLLRRLGLRVVAASGAVLAADVGTAVTELRPFDGPLDLLEALADARLTRPGLDGRAGETRPRGRRNRTRKS
jgi:predicted metal-dependent phosphoesterase TrpH